MLRMDDHPPFVGRQQELVYLTRILNETHAGNGTLVFIAGEAGVGKSRLGEEFSKLARTAGFGYAVGRCVPGGHSPYLPFQDAFNRISPPEHKHLGLRGWLKGPKESATDKDPRRFYMSPVSEREKTLHDALELLQKTCERQPILVILEDLQWADPSSVQLLHFLARNLRDLRLLLFATYRPEDIVVNADGSAPPLVEALRVMRRENVCKELTLQRLGQGELESAIEGMLGGQVEQGLLGEIVSESGGNPLFAIETVRWLLEAGVVGRKNEVWTRIARQKIDLPSTIKEVILRRIERLPISQRQILECASVMGERFDPAIIEDALRLRRLDLLESLDIIQRTSLLISSLDSGYKFSHEKIRQTIYEDVSQARQKELHSIVAHVLEMRLPDEDLYGQLSYHFNKTGEQAKCAKYSLLAAQISLRRAAPREALLYFERTLETMNNDSSLETRLQAVEGVGDSSRAIGLFDPAFSQYQEYLKLTHSANAKVRLLRKSAEIGPSSKVVALLDEAETYGEREPIEEGRIRRIRGHLAFSLGSLGDAKAFYGQSREIFEQLGAREDYAYALLDQTALYLATGEVEHALDCVTKASRIFADLQSPSGELAATKQLGDIKLNQGLYKEALLNYDRVLELASKYERYPYMSFARVYRLATFLMLHDLTSARAEGLILREYAKMARFPYDRIIPALLLAFVQLRLDKREEGEKLYLEASQVLSSLGNEIKVGLLAGPDIRFYSIPLNLAVEKATLAELFAGKGEWTRSNEAYHQCIERWSGSVNGPAFRALSRIYFSESLARQGLKVEAREQLRQALETFEKLGNRRETEAIQTLLETSK